MAHTGQPPEQEHFGEGWGIELEDKQKLPDTTTARSINVQSTFYVPSAVTGTRKRAVNRASIGTNCDLEMSPASYAPECLHFKSHTGSNPI